MLKPPNYVEALREIVALEVRKQYQYLRQLDSGKDEGVVVAELMFKPCCHKPAKIEAYRLCAESLLGLLQDLGVIKE